MPAKLRQVLPHAVMLFAALLLYWAAARIDVDTGGRIGPSAWPKAIIAILALLCIYEIGKRLLADARLSAKGLIAELTRSPVVAPAANDAVEAEPRHPRKLALGIALVAAYVVLVPWLGFFVATACFLALFPIAGGLWRPALAAGLGLAGSLVLVFVFMRVAYISLPLGAGPFRALSLGLMNLIGVK